MAHRRYVKACLQSTAQDDAVKVVSPLSNTSFTVAFSLLIGSFNRANLVTIAIDRVRTAGRVLECLACARSMPSAGL